MMRLVFLLIAMLVLQTSYGGDTIHALQKKPLLKGYKKLFYNFIILHPQLNSALERDLLKHYLAGNGTVFQFSDSDFVQLKKRMPAYADSICTPIEKNNTYCSKRVHLINDSYFGWGLGTITCIFEQQQMVSFFDVYDFNKKKAGERKRKLEFITRLFGIIAPKSARSFIVTYAKEAYYVY